MKKIKTLFVIDRNTDMATNVVNEGCEWVSNGEGVATIKFDGTSCWVNEGKLYKRFDRKLKKSFSKMARNLGDKFIPEDHMFNDLPEGAIPCEEKPAAHSLHFPHWVEVGEGPEDVYHREGFANSTGLINGKTYELVGPKLSGNPYNLDKHELWEHGNTVIDVPDRTYEWLKALMESMENEEGVVFHHPDGRMAKVRRKDFGMDVFGKFDMRSKHKK